MLRKSWGAIASATINFNNISCKSRTGEEVLKIGVHRFSRAFGTSNSDHLHRYQIHKPSLTFLANQSLPQQRQHQRQRQRPFLSCRSFFSSDKNSNRIHDVKPDSLALVDVSEDKNKDDGNGNSGTTDKNPTFQTEKSSKYFLRFTCKVCDGSNAHLISKQAYSEGVVIVTCPSCSSHHLIADNLNWFEDIKEKNIEEIMRSKGEKVIKVLSSDVKEILPD